MSDSSDSKKVAEQEFWDEQKLAQLIHFAEASPEQKLDWLEDVFTIFSQFLPARDAT